MTPIDWRDLYASNRAAIERAGVPPLDLPLPLHDGPVSPAHGPLANLRLPLHDLPRIRPPRIRRPHAAAQGRARGALVHVPAGLDPTVPAPLVCMLHGCTQDPESF